MTPYRDTIDWGSLLFLSPAQTLVRALISQPTSELRIETEEQVSILRQFEAMGLVSLSKQKGVFRLRNEHPLVCHLKRLVAYCDLSPLIQKLEAFSKAGVLFGSRGRGDYRSDSDYDLFVVSDDPEGVNRQVQAFPLAGKIELVLFSESEFDRINELDPGLMKKLASGFMLWGDENLLKGKLAK